MWWELRGWERGWHLPRRRRPWEAGPRFCGWETRSVSCFQVRVQHLGVQPGSWVEMQGRPLYQPQWTGGLARSGCRPGGEHMGPEWGHCASGSGDGTGRWGNAQRV